MSTDHIRCPRCNTNHFRAKHIDNGILLICFSCNANIGIKFVINHSIEIHMPANSDHQSGEVIYRNMVHI